MAKRINYDEIIKYIKLSEEKTITLNQELAKKLVGDELPKSCFTLAYYKNEKNELMRFLKTSGHKIEFHEPKIVIHKTAEGDK